MRDEQRKVDGGSRPSALFARVRRRCGRAGNVVLAVVTLLLAGAIVQANVTEVAAARPDPLADFLWLTFGSDTGVGVAAGALPALEGSTLILIAIGIFCIGLVRMNITLRLRTASTTSRGLTQRARDSSR